MIRQVPIDKRNYHHIFLHISNEKIQGNTKRKYSKLKEQRDQPILIENLIQKAITKSTN